MGLPTATVQMKGPDGIIRIGVGVGTGACRSQKVGSEDGNVCRSGVDSEELTRFLLHMGRHMGSTWCKPGVGIAASYLHVLRLSALFGMKTRNRRLDVVGGTFSKSVEM